MGTRFRKSFKVSPGVKVNLNKKGVSTTFGKRGAHHTVNSSGQRTSSVGVPGTGLSYTARSKPTRGRTSGYENEDEYTNPEPPRLGCIFWALVIFLVCFTFKSCSNNKQEDPDIYTSVTTEYSNPRPTTAEVTTDKPNTSATTEEIVTTAEEIAEATTEATTEEATTEESTEAETESTTEYVQMVWVPASGSKYHKSSSCSGMKNPSQVSLSDAESRGYTPCKKCY